LAEHLVVAQDLVLVDAPVNMRYVIMRSVTGPVGRFIRVARHDKLWSL